MYEESIDCRLVKSALVEDRVLNWNRINCQICFNYLQQEFYLVSPTMKTLAAGKSQKAILKLLRILINTSQSNFGDLNLDDECIRDIADVITTEGAGAAAAGDRPRGAVLTSTPTDADLFGENHQAAASFAGASIKEVGEKRADGKQLAYV